MATRKTSHRLAPLGIALLSLACAGMASAQTASSSSRGSMAAAVPGADRAFMQKAAVGGMAEVELGKLAQDKGASDQVKQFGGRMVEDHSKANDELKEIAGAKGVQLPTSLDAKHQKMMERMQKMSGVQFDRAYMSEMLKDHKVDVADFQKESRSGRDADVKGFATKTLPTLQEHLQMAQATNSAAHGSRAK